MYNYVKSNTILGFRKCTFLSINGLEKGTKKNDDKCKSIDRNVKYKNRKYFNLYYVVQQTKYL